MSAAQGRYALLSGGSNRKHFLVDWTQSKVVSTHTAVAATLWDGQLWITKSTAGHLSMSRLGSTAAAVDVNVGSACVPSELQVNGRFVYWACAAQKKAGVFDRSRGRSVAVPEGDVLLADGFLVRHDNARGKLVRTDVRSGQTVNSDLADLPATKNLMPEGSTSDRRVRWTLDPDSGRAAFVDSGERIHLMPAGTLAAPVRRDHVGRDGIGDLLTLSSSGALTFQQSTGNGAFSDKVSGNGWPTSIKAVPFGDLDGDRCNDVLVRLSSGALRAYKPGCGAALKPSTPYTSLGTSGWIQYDVLTAPGDLTKDGRPDLIARNSSTGTVYLYKGTSTGTLSAPVKLYDNWKTYKKIIEWRSERRRYRRPARPGHREQPVPVLRHRQRHVRRPDEGFLQLGRFLQRDRRRRGHQRRRESRPGLPGQRGHPLAQQRRRQGILQSAGEGRHRLAGLQGLLLGEHLSATS